MNNPTNTVLLLAALAVVVLAVRYFVKTLFFRRATRPATRLAHVGDALVMLMVAALWTGLLLLVLLGAGLAAAGGAAAWGIWMAGGAILLGLLWGAGRHLWQALSQSGSALVNPQQEPVGKADTSQESKVAAPKDVEVGRP